jgi:hypothetical protein
MPPLFTLVYCLLDSGSDALGFCWHAPSMLSPTSRGVLPRRKSCQGSGSKVLWGPQQKSLFVLSLAYGLQTMLVKFW